MKILILYFTAVGATKKIAEMMAHNLSQHEVEIYSVEFKVIKDFSSYDALIVGTPTHHAEPAKYLINYFTKIPHQQLKIPTFVFNTKGLASCNTNRILAQKLLRLNLIPIYEADYIAPASDGSLFLPQLPRFFKFEKDVEAKVIQDCTRFVELISLQKNAVSAILPPVRISSFINFPNKFLSQFVKMRIHLHEEECIKCSLCINKCPYKAIDKTVEGFPVVIKSKCTNCYRCIHKCPTIALGLWKNKKHSKLLKY